MKIIKLIIAVGLFNSISCFGQNFNSKKELKVFNSVFIDLIGTHYYYERPLTPPVPLEYCETHEDSLLFFQRNTEIEEQIQNPKVDTSRLVIAFNKTLILPSIDEIKTTKNRIDNPKYFVPDSIIIDDFIPLLTTLIDSNKYSPIQIRLSDIENTGRYELRDLKQFRIDNPRYTKIKGFRFIGDMMFSRVYFNDSYDKGVFYRYFLCGGDCGSGDIILVEKKENKWIIKWTLNLWVS